MTISLAAGDATNLALRLLKVVEEVLGKPKPGSTGSNKTWRACTHNHTGLQECRLQTEKFLQVTLQVEVVGDCRPGGTTRPRLPRRLARRGDRAIGQSGSAIVFGSKRSGMNEPQSISAPFLEH